MDKQFLKKVWALQDPKPGYYFCLSTIHPKTGAWKDHFFTWPLKTNELLKFERQFPQEKYNVYFCPTPFNNQQRKKSFVIGSKLLWADLDETRPKDCDIKPQIAWKSSNRRYASLWILDQFYDSATIEKRNKALSYNIGADKGGWDLTQVLRLPGTLNHKYSPIEAVRELWFKKNPIPLRKFPEHIYQQLDPQSLIHEYKKKIKPSTLNLLTSKRATEGKRSEVIWRINNDLAEQGLSAQVRFNLLKGSVWNKFAGREDEADQLMREVDKVESVKVLEVEEQDNVEKKVVRMGDIATEKIEWLWFPYIALGKVTLLEGDPGLGKSWFTLALAAYVSAGRKLPREKTAFTGKVLLMSAEDGLGDTIRPRLDLLEANVNKVFAYNTRVYLDEDGLAEIDKEIEKVKPALVIVDPIVAFMGSDVDMHRANEVRKIMDGLAWLAQKHGCAVLAIRHHNKASGVKAIHKGQGSVDFSAATRSIMMIGVHPEDGDVRCIVHIKNNLDMKGDTIEYSLDKGRKNPFRFEGFSYLTERDILDAPSKESNASAKQAAEKLISDACKGKSCPQEMLYRDAGAEGIDKKTLERVAEKMEIKKLKVKGKIMWMFA